MTKEDFRNKIDEEISIIEEQSEFLIDELKYFKNNITNENRNFIYEDIFNLKMTLFKFNQYLKKIYIKERREEKMYEVTFTVDGVIHKATIPATDFSQIHDVITQMYGSSKVTIINFIRKD